MGWRRDRVSREDMKRQPLIRHAGLNLASIPAPARGGACGWGDADGYSALIEATRLSISAPSTAVMGYLI